MKKVAYIASECVPFIKTGGLADVVGTLPRIFDKKEYDVRVIIPNYMCLPAKFKEKMRYLTHFHMDIGWKQQYVGVMYLEYEGVPVYFIDNEYYFNGFNIYSDDMKWDIEKFCYFSKAALSILPSIGFQPDIVHCHDWQAGLVPVYLKTLFADNPFYSGMKSIMTIHNLQFQGRWDIKTVQEYSGLPDYLFTPDKLEIDKDASMLKGGLVYADKITTVSNTYAQEIQTPYYGEGLDGLLRARNQSLWGIVNGIDYKDYDPATDKKIYKNYTLKNFRKNKVANKLALQKELGLPEDKNARASVAYEAETAFVKGTFTKREHRKQMGIFFGKGKKNSIEWSVSTGLAQIYALRFKYMNTTGKPLPVRMQFIDSKGVTLKDDILTFPETPDKWKMVSTTTGTFINAGYYKVLLSAEDMNGLAFDALEIQ